MCWRTVPTSNSGIGEVARACEPFMRQVFVTGNQDEELLKRQVTQIQIIMNNKSNIGVVLEKYKNHEIMILI